MRAHPFTRDALRRLGELFVLTGFAVAQPLLDVLGKGADVFVFRQAGRGDIVQLMLIVLFGPSLALWAVECLAGLVREVWARAVHLAFVGLLFAVIGVELVKNVAKVPAVAVVVLALAFGAALVVLYARSASFRLWLRYALVAPVAFALLFAFGTPVKSQLLPQASAGRTGATTATGGTSSVVMVVLDEFPLQSLIESDGTIDPKLYPNFAALAKASNFYRNTTTNAWYTPFAVPALLTGRYPAGRRVPTVGEYPDNLFTMFGPDYHRNVHELLHLCPNRLCGHTQGGLGESGLKPLLKDSAKAFRGIVNPRDENVDEANQFVEETEHDEGDAADAEAAARLGNPRSFGLDPKSLKANQPTRFTDFLGSLDGKHPKSVNFLHILMPHSPWRFTPSGARYTAPEPAPGLVKGEWVKDPRPIEIARQRHVVQVRYLDGLIGQLIQRLKVTGMWDRATIVITSDHGISFSPGSRKRGATEANYDEIAWVPLFVKTPGQTTGATSDENAQSIDVLPTIADAMGVRLPFPVDGRSLLSGEDRPLAEPRTFYREPEKVMKLDGVAGFARMKTRTVTQFARGENPDLRLYQVGQHGSLVGRAVTDLPAGPPLGTRVSLREREAYGAVDPKKELPAFGYGTTEDESLRGKQVAIAVNGVIGTVGPAFEFNGKTAFGGILPEQLFKAGANDVAVYLVDTAATPTLHPLELAS
ncbi:MAG TPA: sulfatase-like hydrolase/transferase [Frankiaceae bacterium]|nr:sulfatase-like hydrolase/transferase [Frankiaceae bacterium]